MELVSIGKFAKMVGVTGQRSKKTKRLIDEVKKNVQSDEDKTSAN